MTADGVDGPDYVPNYLWKLLIDERHQRQGFGTAALDLVVEHFRSRRGVDVVTTSAVRARAARSPSMSATASCARASCPTARTSFN
jgi:GNAT superfamily N-acetyltransferase